MTIQAARVPPAPSDTLGIPALEGAPQAPQIWIYPPTEQADNIIVSPIYPDAYNDFILVARLFDRPKYRQRNIIERMFGWLKENRRIVIRFDKRAKSYAAMVSLACAMRCLRHYFSYRASFTFVKTTI